jgi:glycosyltransferase involved in cell wall biosynthesis
LSSEKIRSSLILITNHFPFGNAENFLESEIGYLADAFDKVIILARDVSSKMIRKPDSRYTAYRIDPESDLREKLLALSLYIRNFRRVIRYVRMEVNHVKSVYGYFSFGMKRKMMHDLTKALVTSYHLERLIRNHNLNGNVVLYSYWLTSSALATIFVDNTTGVTIKRISRAHGGDVYESRNTLNYLSFRKVLAVHLDRIYSISENAQRHLLDFTKVDQGKISVARLGTISKNVPDLNLRQISGQYLLVSCSFMVPVKRIDLMIDALAHIKDLNIRWVHIGDGPLRTLLAERAREKLSSKQNIRWEFIGEVSNDDLLEFYRLNYVHLFLNTSSSEGVPVSMMEAQSFGIPVAAPRVGGIPEIVSAETGRLFPPDTPEVKIAGIIEEVLKMERQRYEALRSNAYRNWSTRYNAEKNFPTFVAEILSL